MTLVLALAVLAVTGWVWLAYERWTHAGDVMHCRVVGKDSHFGGEKGSTTYQLDLRVDLSFPGGKDGVYEAFVDHRTWKRYELGDFVEARYRAYSIAGRDFENVTVDGGRTREALGGAVFFTLVVIGLWYVVSQRGWTL